MSLDEAIRSILGERLAADIMASKGRAWAFSVAISTADSSHDPQAIKVLRAHLEMVKQDEFAVSRGPRYLA